ncbi:MAG TPA: multiheme c-type cytochrome [Gemmataceae bacterium]|nr:multiheme c-type cytochrome [Gemmataceae bacterium]
MNRVRVSIGIAMATVVAILGGLVVQSKDQPVVGAEPLPLIAKPAPAQGEALVAGSVGCTAAACHGGPVNGTVPRSAWASAEADAQRWRSSATIWKCYDPHSRAFGILGNDLSIQIEGRLAKPGEKPIDARQDVRCLACHANPTLANQSPHPSHTEGVNCESCHGNASKWQAEHAGWQTGATHQRQLLRAEMTNLSDPAVRVETCAGCHVGAPATDGTALRDMNHDLIAAGHPRLNFDYATYLRALPPHWAEKNRDVSPIVFRPVSDAYRHWLVGCAATTAARHRLLADRANRGPWPELAEFDCYACHRGLDGRRAGSGELVWNEPLLKARLAGFDDADLLAAMRRSNDSKTIRQAADRISESWRDAANKWARQPLASATVAAALADVNPSRWDQACHLYYALLAFDSVDRREPDPRLNAIRNALRIPNQVNGVRVDTPRPFEAGSLPFSSLFRERSQ